MIHKIMHITHPSSSSYWHYFVYSDVDVDANGVIQTVQMFEITTTTSSVSMEMAANARCSKGVKQK